jgi:uncharacterized protein (DUF1015 family)
MAAVPELRPFTALRPLPQLAHRVAAPPYDVVDAEQARAAMLAAPDSFLRVTRPDADPWLEATPAPGEEHEHGRQALHELVRRGVLVRDDAPALWVYRQQVPRSPLGSRVQTGVVGLAGVGDYEAGIIRAHEHTRPDKEEERALHVDVLDAHDEPVFLFHRGGTEVERESEKAIGEVVAAATAREHDLAVTTPDGVWHTLWRISDAGEQARLAAAFAEFEALYVADGHHRSAAAVRLHASRAGLPAEEAGETDGFLAVVFPAADVTVLPYHRLVVDLGDLSPQDLLERLRERFDVEPADGPAQPTQRTEIGLRTALGWHRLRLRDDKPGDTAPGDTAPGDRSPAADGVRGLAVSLLQDLVLAPVLGIQDPRRDPRLAFVGGPDGLAELDAAVEGGGAAAAFALAPTPLDDLVAVSDAGEVLPPKSTWFWPKPASGLLVHPLH